MTEIDSSTAAQSTPQVGGMDMNLFRLQSRELNRRIQVSALPLGGNPHIASVRLNMDRAVHGLHGDVSQIRQVVLGLDLLMGVSEGTLNIPVPSSRETLFLQAGDQVPVHRFRAQSGALTWTPFYVESISTPPGSIQCLGTNRDAGVPKTAALDLRRVHPHDVAYSWYRPCCLLIVGLHLGPIDR